MFWQPCGHPWGGGLTVCKPTTRSEFVKSCQNNLWISGSLHRLLLCDYMEGNLNTLYNKLSTGKSDTSRHFIAVSLSVLFCVSPRYLHTVWCYHQLHAYTVYRAGRASVAWRQVDVNRTCYMNRHASGYMTISKHTGKEDPRIMELCITCGCRVAESQVKFLYL